MTREEAIEQFKYAIDLIKQDGKDYLDERDIPMLEMGIQALEKEIGCKYCQYDNVDGKFDSLCMNCYSHDMWVRKENKE